MNLLFTNLPILVIGRVGDAINAPSSVILVKTGVLYREEEEYMTKIYTINSNKYGNIDVLLDDEDYDYIVKNSIKLHPKYDKTINGFYIQLHLKDKAKKDGRTTIGVHRFIMRPGKDLQVDHINRNTLDNRKSNLRIVSAQGNSNNKGSYKNSKSGVKGVYYIRMFNKWVAELKVNKKCYRSNTVNTKEEAIIERQKLEEKYMKHREGVIV